MMLATAGFYKECKMAKKKRKKAIQTRTWIFKQITYDDGSTTLLRTNTGFNLFELLGLSELAQQELIQQFKGVLPPSMTVKRKVIKEE